MTFVDHIGPLLVSLRQQRGISQAELARRAGISAWQLSKIERNLAAPRYRTRLRLAQELGVDVELFMDMSEYLTALEDLSR